MNSDSDECCDKIKLTDMIINTWQGGGEAFEMKVTKKDLSQELSFE